MEQNRALARRWDSLDRDLLQMIIKSMDIRDFSLGIAHVCREWRSACCDPVLWETLDLSTMISNYIKIPADPYVYVDERSDKELTRVLRVSLSLGRGHVRTLIFHLHSYVRDDQLTYTAERCPQLRRLVLPSWNRIKNTGMSTAIQAWKDLESLTIASIEDSPHLMEEISINCKNFRELKIMGPCDETCADALVSFLPGLKVLSLRCSLLEKDALALILDGLQNLEALNILHCLLYYVVPGLAPRMVFTGLDPWIIDRGSRLRVFLRCTEDSCLMCRRMRVDEGLLRWYKYEEDLWKVDEISSLAV